MSDAVFLRDIPAFAPRHAAFVLSRGLHHGRLGLARPLREAALGVGRSRLRDASSHVGSRGPRHDAPLRHDRLRRGTREVLAWAVPLTSLLAVFIPWVTDAWVAVALLAVFGAVFRGGRRLDERPLDRSRKGLGPADALGLSRALLGGRRRGRASDEPPHEPRLGPCLRRAMALLILGALSWAWVGRWTLVAGFRRTPTAGLPAAEGSRASLGLRLLRDVPRRRLDPRLGALYLTEVQGAAIENAGLGFAASTSR